MSPKKARINFGDVIKPSEEFGVLVGKDIIPKPIGRGRTAIVPKLTIAKMLDEALKEIAENGIGVSEEKVGFDLRAPGTLKEAKRLGLKNVAVAFFSYIVKELEQFKLKDTVEIVRRDEGRKIYLRGLGPGE
jgi:hypothetical protein